MKKVELEQAQELQERDLQMMQEPQRWPAYPRLPLKRTQGGGWPELGFLQCVSGVVPPIVYLGNIYDHLSVQQLERLEYSGFHELQEAGWVVD